VSVNNTISDLLTITNGVISANDAGADRIFFWDESQSKATHLSVGAGVTIDGNTLKATIAAGKTYTLDAVDSVNDVILIQYHLGDLLLVQHLLVLWVEFLMLQLCKQVILEPIQLQ